MTIQERSKARKQSRSNNWRKYLLKINALEQLQLVLDGENSGITRMQP